jgi:hypothetical protein
MDAEFSVLQERSPRRGARHQRNRRTLFWKPALTITLATKDLLIFQERLKLDIMTLLVEKSRWNTTFLKGADTDYETGGLHIHKGTTCDDKDLVEGHYWDSGKVEDPWTTEGGAIYTSKSDGKAKGKFTLDAGYDVAANDGHAVVVHDKATGARYGCGILSSSKKLKGSSCK